MNIYESLESGHSKEQCRAIIDYIGNNPDRMQELMTCFFDENYRICQRAAWPVGMIVDKQPELLQPYLSEMIENLSKPSHDAVVRNTLRVFQIIEVPEELEGIVYERCFNYLVDPKYPVAIRVFSMTVLTNIAHKFPELKEELIDVIETHYEHGSAGFKSRARKSLKILKK